MPTAIAPIAALLLSVAFLLMGHGLQGTLLPVRAQLEKFDGVMTVDVSLAENSATVTVRKGVNPQDLADSFSTTRFDAKVRQ